MFEITKEGRFEASHILVGHQGACGRLHGHSYRFAVTLKGPAINEVGMLLDFAELPVKRIEAAYDHQHLNGVGLGWIWTDGESDQLSRVKGHFTEDQESLRLFVTSAECIAKTIFKFVDGILHTSPNALLAYVEKVTVWETAKCSATYSYVHPREGVL